VTTIIQFGRNKLHGARVGRRGKNAHAHTHTQTHRHSQDYKSDITIIVIRPALIISVFAGEDSHKAFSLHESRARRPGKSPTRAEMPAKRYYYYYYYCTRQRQPFRSRATRVGRRYGCADSAPAVTCPVYCFYYYYYYVYYNMHRRREPTADGVRRFDVYIKIMVGSEWCPRDIMNYDNV